MDFDVPAAALRCPLLDVEAAAGQRSPSVLPVIVDCFAHQAFYMDYLFWGYLNMCICAHGGAPGGGGFLPSRAFLEKCRDRVWATTVRIVGVILIDSPTSLIYKSRSDVR